MNDPKKPSDKKTASKDKADEVRAAMRALQPIAKELGRELAVIRSTLEALDPRETWVALPTLRRVRAAMRAQRRPYNQLLRALEKRIGESVFDGTYSFAAGARYDMVLFGNIGTIRERWRMVESEVESMFAETLAWLSVWLGALSIVLTVLPWLLRMLPGLPDASG